MHLLAKEHQYDPPTQERGQHGQRSDMASSEERSGLTLGCWSRETVLRWAAMAGSLVVACWVLGRKSLYHASYMISAVSSS